MEIYPEAEVSFPAAAALRPGNARRTRLTVRSDARHYPVPDESPVLLPAEHTQRPRCGAAGRRCHRERCGRPPTRTTSPTPPVRVKVREPARGVARTRLGDRDRETGHRRRPARSPDTPTTDHTR